MRWWSTLLNAFTKSSNATSTCDYEIRNEAKSWVVMSCVWHERLNLFCWSPRMEWASWWCMVWETMMCLHILLHIFVACHKILHVFLLHFVLLRLCGEFLVVRWSYQIETFSALLVLCVGNWPVPDDFPSQRLVMRSFVFSDLRLNKRLTKESRRRWSETPSRSLWHYCNGSIGSINPYCFGSLHWHFDNAIISMG